MSKLHAAAIGLALFAAPTLAQAASAAKMTGTDQNQSQNQNSQSIRQQVANNLRQAGFSDIKVMPQSFLVRAKDQNGNAVMMVINPDSVMAVTEYKGQNNGVSGNNKSGTGNID